ncbi:MAG: hypothetical protein COY58_00245 [Gammaproteobacteria bacterium CG_4_10_14_0_8_um_filter_38_16]|nr:MAG: hypothetical protein COY58_00245 [Gammaproteobacteria bacterium CG_4_10_14_0_8_um_filter_38_16]PJB10734.1 MAG: hypothetical protein CO120_03445 [Gammaproteobacteria bacterium CG_4_9_14_3_um_filter_38_9]
MVADGASLYQIKNYLSRWLFWWLKTARIWNYDELANRYIDSCWDPIAQNMAMGFFQQEATILHTDAQACGHLLALAL